MLKPFLRTACTSFRLCEHLGLTNLPADPRFASNSGRLHNRDALCGEIEAALAPLSRDAVCRDPMRQGVPVGPVNTVPQAFQQPHAAHRGTYIDRAGYRGIGVPTRLSRTPGRAAGTPPAYGQHTQEILREAGFDETRIAELRESGVLPREPGS